MNQPPAPPPRPGGTPAPAGTGVQGRAAARWDGAAAVLTSRASRAGRGLAAVVLTCGLLLAGCVGGAVSPDPTPSSVIAVSPSEGTASSTPEQSPSSPPTLPADLPEPLADQVTEPVYPEAAREFTHDGAAAFVQYVMDATNWAYAVGDATYLLDHCDEESGYCRNVAGNSSAMSDGGVTRYGGLVRVDLDAIDLYQDEQDALVSGTITIDRYVDIDDDGAVQEDISERTLEVTFHIAFADSAWRLLLAGGE